MKNELLKCYNYFIVLNVHNMARPLERERALQLRREGKSYREIKGVIKVSKSTLSYWLKGMPLSKERMRELRDWNELRIEKYRETRRKKRETLLQEIYKREKNVFLPLSARDVLIAGLFLYWGEGGKTTLFSPCLSNTSPAVIKAFLFWLMKTLGVKRGKIKIKLHLYADMNAKKETAFWSGALDIPTSQFGKPYIKESKFAFLSYKKSFGHGTCNAWINDAILGKKIMMGIKVIDDYFGKL